MPLIFVTGASRSGTTMLTRILGNHSDVLGLNELHYFGDLWNTSDSRALQYNECIDLASQIYARQRNVFWNAVVSSSDTKSAQSILEKLPEHDRTGYGIFEAVLNDLATSAGKRLACEQTPRNIFYAKKILDYYPDAKVVQIVRDPRAVLASQKNRWKRKRFGGANVPWLEILRVWINYHPFTLSRLWNKAISDGLTLSTEPRFHLLKYEDLVAEPEDTLYGLCEFLGIEFQRSMLDVPIVGSSHRANKETEQGISKEGLNSWKGSLTKGEIAICEHISLRNMESLGYESSHGNPYEIPALVHWLSYPLHAIGVVLVNPKRAMIQIKALINR